MNDMDCAQLYGQKGLSYLPPYAIFATFFLKPAATRAGESNNTYRSLKNIVSKIDDRIRHIPGVEDDQHLGGPSDSRITNAVLCGVSLDLWETWCRQLDMPLPHGFEQDGAIAEIDRILNTSPPYKLTGGSLYFHIKSDTYENGQVIYNTIKDELEAVTQDIDVTRGNHMREGKVYGRRILHGLIRTVDPINLSQRVLVGDEDPPHKGSCFALTQKFVHNWEQIGQMSEVEIEDMIGRDHDGNLIPHLDERSHMRLARVKDEDGLNYRVFTQGQPFGDSPTGHQREAGVYVSALAKSITAFNEILGAMLGENNVETGEIKDKHMRVSSSVSGNIWYIPTSAELDREARHNLLHVKVNDYFDRRSANGLMHYNSKHFLHTIWQDRQRYEYPLTDRVIELLGNTFSRWHNSWYELPPFPSLPSLADYLSDPAQDLSAAEQQDQLNAPIAERKGLTIKYTLGDLFSKEDDTHGKDLFRLDPKEIIVGVLPPFTLGSGVVVMPYLREDERLNGFFMKLDETSMAGHTVPDYDTVLKTGIGRLLEQTTQKLNGAGDGDRRNFYQSVVYALEGVRGYFRNYAALAIKKRDQLPPSLEADRANLTEIAARMDRLAVDAPGGFIDALQMIFSLHCCMHLIGELVSIGRLDQLLQPFFDRDSITEQQAQEAVDCFWIKMDEQVLMNRHYFLDQRTYGTCALPYISGTVPKGDKLSQWVMQVTVGGYLSNDDEQPQDGCNTVTQMCLRAARRLPLNSPCLNLRVNARTPDPVIHEAARTILSGGAHPVLFNDDLLMEGLLESGAHVLTRDARNWCADGCWETIFPGTSELTLSYIVVPLPIEMALNQGATYLTAGPSFIRGDQASFLSPPAEAIADFDQFMDIFYSHFKWMMATFYNGIFTRYGRLWNICPSPLLSSMMQGCLESGRDLTDGGARYRIISPILGGITCAVDSLWTINKLVFDPATAVAGLAELRDCLMCDWGHDMIAPVMSLQAGEERMALRARRFKDLRKVTLNMPRFGSGHADVDEFAGVVASQMRTICERILRDPAGEVSAKFKQKLDSLQDRYGRAERPFEFLFMPAFGTFEDYLGVGRGVAASADGRRKGSTLSSNFSPLPSPMDLPPDARPRNVFTALKGWNGETFAEALKSVAPVDIDIPEDFPISDLEEVIRQFKDKKLGSNMLSISCADKETIARAQKYPEGYDLLRLRMGGWSEFFITMYTEHQEQHKRRPLFVVN
jgi:pyruvate-formate lyase/deferrochelatase/peroxidase EfeB